jgi:DNA-binding MarR family transcriptional regulator
MNTNLIKITAEALEAIRDFTGNTEIPTQTVLVFLHIALRKECAMADLEKLVGISQTGVSRNVSRLAQGLSQVEPGQKLIEAFEDPAYRRRKLVKLTKKGELLLDLIEQRCGKYYQPK